MISYICVEYDDIDGSRGIPVRYYEIEDADHYEIAEQIQSQLEEGYENTEFPKELNVFLYCNETEEYVELPVKVKDYLPYGGE